MRPAKQSFSLSTAIATVAFGCHTASTTDSGGPYLADVQAVSDMPTSVRDVSARTSQWPRVTWAAPDAQCEPLPPPIPSDEPSRPCGPNCETVSRASPKLNAEIFERDGLIQTDLAMIFRYDPVARSATMSWPWMQDASNPSRFCIGPRLGSPVWGMLQPIGDTQYHHSCYAGGESRILSVFQDRVCLKATVPRIRQTRRDSFVSAPHQVTRVAGAYVWMQLAERAKDDVVILDDGADSPRFLTECGCSNHMIVSHDRIVYVRTLFVEPGGTELWIADPPYREGRRVWAPGRSIQRFARDPTDDARIVFEVTDGDEVDPRGGDVYFADVRTLDTDAPRNLTNDSALQIWPVIRGNRIAFCDYRADTLNPTGPIDVAHNHAALTVMDLTTNQRVVLLDQPGGFSPLYLGTDSVYLPIRPGDFSRVRIP